ncbi:MAG: hypothetical protein IJ024_06855 [Lachnospiraceae bacterium]|nr:hypothetical protein [Lachnospiraceae bacterium]
MDVKIFAICDAEKQYARKLMEAFCEKKNFGFQIHAFSQVEELKAFAEQTQIEVLLISGKVMSETISRMNIGKIILLSDGEIYEAFSDYESIYKYQSAEHIMKEVLCYYAEYAKPVTGMHYGKQEFEVYGVYSPVGRCGKSALAESLAGSFGKSKKTLLLDLQSFSALKEQLSDEELWDLADIIYFLRQGKKTFLYKLNSIVRSRETFDYILPMKTPADIRSVTLAEWTELLEKLALDSDYRVVIIDFGNDVCGLFQLLSQCTKVYIPVLSDAISKGKVENFEWNLKEEHFEKVLESSQKIYLPGGFDRMNARTFMEDWVKKAVML